jgi:exonuclease VII large subunit
MNADMNAHVPARPDTETILTVAALTRLIRGTLQEGFPAVWEKGELSG